MKMTMKMKMKTPGKYLQAFLRARCRSCLTPMALGLGMEAAQTLNTEGKILFYLWRNTFWYREEFKWHSDQDGPPHWTLTTEYCKNYRGNTFWNWTLVQVDTDIYTVYCIIYSHSNVLHCCELHFTLVHIKATACASDSIGIRGISPCVNFSAFHFLQHLHFTV